MLGLEFDAFRNWITDVGLVVLQAAFWLVGGWWLSRVARSSVQQTLTRHALDWNGTILLARLVSMVIRVFAVLLALNTLGVPGTGLLAVVSAFTVAIGLSLQDVLKNFFAGIYLLLERPFRTGDRIVVRDVVGEVQGIDIRTTLIKNRDNELVLVPNATIFTEILRNDTYFGVRRIQLTISSDTRSVTEIAELMGAALTPVDGVKHPISPPRILSKKGDTLTMNSSLVVDNTDAVQNAAAQAIIDALPGDSVEVAAP